VTEGPGARVIADRMREVLEGRTLDLVEYRSRNGEASLADHLRGVRVVGVESHGKNILVHVEGGESFRIHLLMHGRVRIGPKTEALTGPLRLAFHADGQRVAVVGSPKIELLPTAQLERRRSQWGPDATRPDFDADRFLENLTKQGDRTIGEALLDQSVVAGVGNKWKCEILHLAKVDPRTPVAALTFPQRGRLARLVPATMRAAYERRRDHKEAGLRVYHRDGRPCRSCGALIVSFRLGGRTTYSCPVCQPAPHGG
jgi:endonuclease VIII